MEAKINLYKQMRTLMAQQQSLSQIEEAIILAHAINVSFGLQCVTRNGDKLQYPSEWQHHQYGVYKFQYSLDGKNILFRFVNNDNRNLSVNFVEENSEDLHQISIEFVEAELEHIIKSYEKQLEKLKTRKEQKKSSLIVDRPGLGWQRQPQVNPPYNPYERPRYGNNNPFRLPEPGNEYVGPDNEIFRRGGQNNNPFSLDGLRRPPGSRYDPTNPFNMDEDNPRAHDFQGFNQFGAPRGGRTNFNPFG